MSSFSYTDELWERLTPLGPIEPFSSTIPTYMIKLWEQ